MPNKKGTVSVRQRAEVASGATRRLVRALVRAPEAQCQRVRAPRPAPVRLAAVPWAHGLSNNTGV